MRAGNPLELHLATFEEHDGRGRGVDELVHRAGHEHLAADRLSRDACREVHGATDVLLGLLDRVARVDADPHADRARSPNSRSISSWIACAHATARRALEKASIDPSPCVPATAPPWAADTASMSRLWRRMTSSQARSPRRASIGVESTMSVNMIVTVPSTASEADRSGRSRWIVRSSSSSETVSDRPRVSKFDRGNDQWTWTIFHSPRSRWRM